MHAIMKLCVLAAATCMLLGAAGVRGQTTSGDADPKWRNGLPNDPAYFPIGVWLQDPRLASQYQELGINLYVSLWKGPTEQQLRALREANMRVICSLNDYARELLERNDPLLEVVAGWMHQDEPDNAQRNPEGGYGPPVEPAVIVAGYEAMKQTDPTRPIYLNLGQGVAWDQWTGRGVRRNKPEDYPQYVQGSDIVSFDIYPASSDRAIKGQLWRVGFGVKRLREWSGPDKTIWAHIECTRIRGGEKATPEQVRAMVWMALVNGATGIQYFVHEWDSKGKLVSASQLLNDPEMREAVMRINQQIHELAPVLNRPSPPDVVTIRSSADNVPIDAMVKRTEDAVYLFAVAMRGEATTASIQLAGLDGAWRAQVLGEDRTIDITNGAFEDDFGPWGVHLYRITPIGATP